MEQQEIVVELRREAAVPASVGGERPEADAASLADVVLRALDGPAHDDLVVTAGWRHGRAACESGATLSQLLRDLERLEGALLPRVLEAGEGQTADLVVRLHVSAVLLRSAALEGFAHAGARAFQKQLRDVRHDLRNPVGTIRNALSMLGDEPMTGGGASEAAERFRAMATRNARTLEGMIRQRLSETSLRPAALSAAGGYTLRELAAEVRRQTRAAAEALGVGVVVGDELPTLPVSSAGVELLLRSVVAMGIRCARPPADVVIGFERLDDRVAVVRVAVSSGPGGGRDAHERELAHELASALGGATKVRGTFAADGAVTIELPVSAG